MIYIEPAGGLCNRMRAISSAYHLAQELGQKLTIVWTAKPELNCSYEKLFLPPPVAEEIQVAEGKGKTSWRYKIWRSFSGLYLEEADVERLRGTADCIPRDVFLGKKHIYIHTGLYFYTTGEYSKLFLPTCEIRNRVEALKHSWPSRVVGIHIRRTDNKDAITGSSTEGFIRRMEMEIEQDAQTGFYLATDSKREEEVLRERFGKRIFGQGEKVWERDREEGITAALVDFLCLAGTKKIIGSYWSSFSDLAAEYYGIEKVIVKDG